MFPVGMDYPTGKKPIPLRTMRDGSRIKDQLIDHLSLSKRSNRDQGGKNNNNQRNAHHIKAGGLGVMVFLVSYYGCGSVKLLCQYQSDQLMWKDQCG